MYYTKGHQRKTKNGHLYITFFYPTYFWSNNGNNRMEFELVFYLYAQFLTNKDCSNCIWRWTFYLRNNNTFKVYIDTIEWYYYNNDSSHSVFSQYTLGKKVGFLLDCICVLYVLRMKLLSSFKNRYVLFISYKNKKS